MRESNQSLTETVQMLKALQTIYFLLFYVNLETGHYDTIYIAPWMKAAIPESGDYDTLRKLFIDGFIVPAFHEDINAHMSIPYIREALNRAKSIRCTQKLLCRLPGHSWRPNAMVPGFCNAGRF